MQQIDNNYDAVVIGGGIIGVSAAWQLARRGLARVAILEKGAQIAAGSTGQSSAVVRQRYANFPLVQLAQASVRMFHHWRDALKLKEDRSGFHPVGVIWIDDVASSCQESLRMFQQAGAAGGVITQRELQELYPALNLCTRALDMTGIEHDCQIPETLFWESEGGYADPQGTTEDLLLAATNSGAQLFLRHEVVRIDLGGGNHVQGVHCANGESFSCPLVLNAAGPWCQQIHQMVDVKLPMDLRPTRVQIAHRDRPAEVEGPIPVFVSAADRIYGRPETHGQQLLIGSVDPEDEREHVDDPDHYDTRATADFRHRMMHKLHHRFRMKNRGQVGGYAALYTVNTTDWHPILDGMGPEGYFLANGFSGHGFKLGPSIGALIARMMTGISLPDDAPVDPRYFAADRQPISSSGGVLA